MRCCLYETCECHTQRDKNISGKMVAIFQLTIPSDYFNENSCFMIQMLLKLVPVDMINDNVALVLLMMSSIDRPLPEPMLTKFHVAIWYYQ